MKIVKKSNFRVEIEPSSHYYGYLTQKSWEEDTLSECKRIAEEARRHVDDHGGIEVLFDLKTFCSFCDREWEEDEKTGEPFCCEKAIIEWEDKTKTQNSLTISEKLIE